MKIGDIMHRAPVTVRMDQTFAEAFRLLAERHFTILPVVDAQGVHKGNFELRDVWDVLLPKAVKLDRKAIEDLSFVSSSVDKLKDLLADRGGEPVSNFVNGSDSPAIHPDSPLLQAILLLEEFGQSLVVVDRGTHKVVGVVSAWEVLDSLR